MTVYLGSASFQEVGDQFEISSPVGFDSVEAVRITNFTVDALILNNIDGQSNSVEYLMPFMQMVWPIKNVQKLPTMRGLQLGADIKTERILVEWSTDADTDFIGTYPVTLVVPPVAKPSDVPAIGFVSGSLAVPDDGTTYDIPTDASLLSLTFYNDPVNGNAVMFSATDDGWTDSPSPPVLVKGAGASIGSGNEVYFRGTGNGDSTIYWFGDSE